MKCHRSLKPKLTSHKKKTLQKSRVFLSWCDQHITKQGLPLPHPRYQISTVLIGNLWTVSIKLKAQKLKMLSFIKAKTESTFLKVTGQGSKIARPPACQVCILLLGSTTSTHGSHLFTGAAAPCPLNFTQRPRATCFLDSIQAFTDV